MHKNSKLTRAGMKVVPVLYSIPDYCANFRQTIRQRPQKSRPEDENQLLLGTLTITDDLAESIAQDEHILEIQGSTDKQQASVAQERSPR